MEESDTLSLTSKTGSRQDSFLNTHNSVFKLSMFDSMKVYLWVLKPPIWYVEWYVVIVGRWDVTEWHFGFSCDDLA